jgi:hypothetical protein
MIWQVYHHLVGLRRLGFDVWYVEDSDRLLYDPITYNPSNEYRANIELLAHVMDNRGLEERWIFRVPQSNSCLGALDQDGLKRLYQEVDAVLNLYGAQEIREEHKDISCLIYLETDPVEDQVAVAKGDAEKIYKLDAHHYHFTYGTNFGAADCLVPLGRYTWYPTQPPVYLNFWKSDAPSPDTAALTTIANWKHKGKDVQWQGHTWHWSKHLEFQRFLDLPRHSALPLELAVGAIGSNDRQHLSHHGWRTVPSTTINAPQSYHDYICNSLGEFTVAKEQYVAPRCGWFSDRSVCYLASGKPVLLQDTGLSDWLPTGARVLTFNDIEQAQQAVELINCNYKQHQQAARAIAEEYFSAIRVLPPLVEAAMA